MTGPDPRPGPLTPEQRRTLQDNAADAQAFAASMGDDPVAPPGALVTGFQISDLRRFVSQLDEARACEDVDGEDVATQLIAGYVRAAVHSFDARGAVG